MAAATSSTVHGIDVGRVEDAVRAAERRTSGEIRVAVARFYFWGDVRAAAERAFARLHMERTRERNGVLIFVAPWRRRFSVLGDDGIHQKVPPTFWQEVADAMAADLRRGDMTAGIVRGVTAVGERLATAFPSDPARDRENQLPDSVALPGRGDPKPGS
jgi:uncharacterized membrane protein